MWCKNCNIETNASECPVCGSPTVPDLPVDVYWCDDCRIPIIQTTNQSDRGICPRCGRKTKYLATDLRPVFPEERLLMELLLHKEPNAYRENSVWAANNRYYIDGKSIAVSNTDYLNADARDRMVEMHLRAALRIALSRAEAYDLDLIETVGEACVGLMYAVDKYDPDTSGPFLTYASFWIFQNITREQETKRPLVYYPVHRKEPFYTIYPLAKKRGCMNCDTISSCPTLRKYIKEKLRCDDAEAGNVVDQMVPFSSLHDLTEYELNAEHGDDRDIPADILRLIYSDDEDEMLSKISKDQLTDALENALSALSPKEAEVIRMRYGFYGKEMTLEEVGQKYHVTRERIRQIEAKGLRKLRSDRYRKFFKGFNE